MGLMVYQILNLALTVIILFFYDCEVNNIIMPYRLQPNLLYD